MNNPGHRITILSTSMGMGGADNQIAELALRLLNRGYEVDVVSLTPLGDMGRRLADRGVPVASMNLTRAELEVGEFIGELLGFAGRIWRNPPDILVTFMFHANVLGRLIGRFARVPTVIASIRNEHFGGPRREWLERALQPLSDVTVTNSRLAAQSLITRGVVPPQKMRVVPNGIALERLKPRCSAARMRESLGLDEELFVWLAVGRLHQQKDYPTLIEALARIAEAPRDYIVLVAGQDVGIRRDLEAQATDLGVRERIRFLGERHDIGDLLVLADGFVCSSAWEGLPNAIMEALACSVPVVATRVGGIPELVEHERSGYLVEPGKPAELARDMARLMALPKACREEMGLYGREHVLSTFDVEAVVDQWIALFKELRGS